jgi:hypothetical protein
MSKKLIMSCMAVFALAAFALPAVASANNKPTLRDNGGIIPIGAKVTGTNSGDGIFYDTGTNTKQVVCTKAVLTGEVTTNDNDTVTGKIMTFNFSGTGPLRNGLNECTDSFGGGASIKVTRTPLLLSSTPAMATDEFQVTGTGGNIKFDIEDTTIGNCEYEATGAVKGDFSTGGTQTTLTTRDTQAGSGAKLVAGGFFCPSSGELKLAFTLETEDGTPIWVESTP